MFFGRVVSRLAALAFLQSYCAAIIVHQQVSLAGDDKSPKDAPGCQDVFNATIHVPIGAESERDSIPVFQLNARLYAWDNKNATHGHSRGSTMDAIIFTALIPQGLNTIGLLATTRQSRSPLMNILPSSFSLHRTKSPTRHLKPSLSSWTINL